MLYSGKPAIVEARITNIVYDDDDLITYWYNIIKLTSVYCY